MQKRQCPHCAGLGRPLGEAWVCDDCYRVFGQPVEPPKTESPSPRELVRAVNYTPQNMAIQRTPRQHAPGSPYRSEGMIRDDLELAWSWNSGKHRVGLFALVWNLFLVPFYFGIIAQGTWAMLLPMLPFMAVGFAFAYLWAGTKFNITTIRVEGDVLSAKQFPFPTRKERRLAVQAIDQMWVEKTVPYQENEEDVVCFSVMLRTRGGEEINLVPHMHTPEQALYTEQQIEDCLGIVDVAVGGEIAGLDKDFTAPTGF